MKSVFLLVALLSTMLVEAGDRNIEYLGDGRYRCTKGDCGQFNAIQERQNRQMQRYDRERREWEQERSRERTDAIIEKTNRDSYR